MISMLYLVTNPKGEKRRKRVYNSGHNIFVFFVT